VQKRDKNITFQPKITNIFPFLFCRKCRMFVQKSTTTSLSAENAVAGKQEKPPSNAGLKAVSTFYNICFRKIILSSAKYR